MRAGWLVPAPLLHDEQPELCTAANDKQVRDGTRFLLKLFHDGGDSWMDYRQDGETDANIDDYDLVHYPWTGILGIRLRQPEEPKPGTYGGMVRRWLSHQHQGN